MDNKTKKQLAERIPWRRYFARGLDLAIYSLIWNLILLAILNENVLDRSFGWEVVDNFFTLLLMYVVEPFLLHWFGTTPGKWIWGISVQNRYGGKLTCGEARNRTLSVIMRGMGCNLPIIALITQLRSYSTIKDGGNMDWEYESELLLKDKHKWRIGVWLAAELLIMVLLAFSIFQTGLPRHKGELTVAEFSDNYNRLATFYGMEELGRLNDEGEWVVNENMHVHYVGRTDEQPIFKYILEDGIVKGISFETVIKDEMGLAPSYTDEMRLLILSYVFAKEECGVLPIKDYNDVLKIVSNPYTSYEKQIYGVNITCEVEYIGYLRLGKELLYAETEEETYYSIRFTMMDM